jgi:hypothetical protein
VGETYAAPTSFVGSARRLVQWAGRNPLKLLAALLAIPVVWLALIPWYFVVFVLFGVFTIPFRFVRRSQRKSLAVQKAQLAELRKLGERDR